MRVDGMQDAGAVIFRGEYRRKNIVGRIFEIEEVPVETPFLFAY